MSAVPELDGGRGEGEGSGREGEGKDGEGWDSGWEGASAKGHEHACADSRQASAGKAAHGGEPELYPAIRPFDVDEGHEATYPSLSSQARVVGAPSCGERSVYMCTHSQSGRPQSGRETVSVPAVGVECILVLTSNNGCRGSPGFQGSQSPPRVEHSQFRDTSRPRVESEEHSRRPPKERWRRPERTRTTREQR